MKRRPRSLRELVAILALLAGCGGIAVTTPEGWQRVDIGSDVELAVPPDAQRMAGTAVDSLAGGFEGDGYRITFDLGEFGEELNVYEEEEGFALTPRKLAGQSAVEIGFVPSDEPFGWARVAQVGAGGGQTLTVRVSCDTRERCALADQVFDSTSFG